MEQLRHSYRPGGPGAQQGDQGGGAPGGLHREGDWLHDGWAGCDVLRHLTRLSGTINKCDLNHDKICDKTLCILQVLEQADILDHVHAEAVTATENTKEGNEAVRQAIQNKASYRVYILFILLVFSFR